MRSRADSDYAKYREARNNVVSSLRSAKSAWKDAIVMPIPKKQGAKTPTEFRPISLLPILSKVLERHVHLLISEHISVHSPLSTCQFGFQSGKSTISALLSVTQDWFRELEKRQEIGAVFFDLKKSF